MTKSCDCNPIKRSRPILPTPAAPTLCLLCAIAIAAGCGKPEQAKADPSSVVKSSFIDARDGKEYRTVKIGKQVWMAENLNFVADSSWCYDNDDDNCEKYGRLYDWDAAMGACPAGWRLPSEDELAGLVKVAGGRGIAGKKLKSKIGWEGNGNGTNNYGWSALPGGYRHCSNGLFYGASTYGSWWSATETEVGSNIAVYRHMESEYGIAGEFYDYKESGRSVRCVFN